MLRSRIIGMVLALSPGLANAQPIDWSRYAIPETGTAVDIPRSIFSEDAGKPESGYGRRFRTSDQRADLTIQSVANVGEDSPAAFLARKKPPPHLVYKKVTPRFFVVSSFHNDRIFYDRCNFSGRFVH